MMIYFHFVRVFSFFRKRFRGVLMSPSSYAIHTKKKNFLCIYSITGDGDRGCQLIEVNQIISKILYII